jgi:hypothetical protein
VDLESFGFLAALFDVQNVLLNISTLAQRGGVNIGCAGLIINPASIQIGSIFNPPF